MRIFFDTEFMEDGKMIELLSIGMVREDGAEYYAECAEADRSRANDWVKANVLPHLCGPVKPRAVIRDEIVVFAKAHLPPEFWAYYCAYDWVALCQLFGSMLKLPRDWPQYCHDLRSFFDYHELGLPFLPESDLHHALVDAKWCARAFTALKASAPYLKLVV